MAVGAFQVRVAPAPARARAGKRDQPIWWFAGAGNPVAAPVVCVLGLGLNRGECGHAERDHHVDLMRLFFLGDAPAARTLDRDGATDGELRP